LRAKKISRKDAKAQRFGGGKLWNGYCPRPGVSWAKR
jgi:hypothetical protein